jgi:ribosomal protein S18 acetylase RimI-like enzyme
MFIDPLYQKKGFGRAIVRHLELFAIEQGYKSIFLESSNTAVEFYQKLGYNIEIDEVVDWLGENIRRIKMKKLLSTVRK